MIKKNYKQVLTDVVEYGYVYLISIKQEMERKEKEPQSDGRDFELIALAETFKLVNDIIHPAHDISKSILKRIRPEVISYCIDAYAQDVKSKPATSSCWCSQCKGRVNGSKDSGYGSVCSEILPA